jgi:hypothetical protein
MLNRAISVSGDPGLFPQLSGEHLPNSSLRPGVIPARHLLGDIEPGDQRVP